MDISHKVFISHSSKDEEARAFLISKLNARGIDPYFFPAIKLPPNKINGTELIEAILQHDALIYMKGGFSERSFWVAFERDYAIRAKKEVYSFDPSTLKIEKSRLYPIQLPIFLSSTDSDIKRLDDLLKFLEGRFFDLQEWSKSLAQGKVIEDSLAKSVFNVARKGGFVVQFLKSNMQPKIIEELRDSMISYPDRILSATLDKDALNSVTSTIQIPSKVLTIQLYGDKIRPEKQRWDDLIVMVYWLIFRNIYELV